MGWCCKWLVLRAGNQWASSGDRLLLAYDRWS
jgi:hypothetical protein